MDVINYELISRKFPWLFKECQKVIISPDVDGLLCGLFMSNYLKWEIIGFYDGKILCYQKGTKIEDCIFLDIEIFRKEVKSCGHHMLVYNNRELPENWDNFQNSLNPNNIRGFDMLHNFKRKYPFATIHFLLCILQEIRKEKIILYNTATVPLLYVDGTFKNLLNYPENCSDWLIYLDAKNPESPIYPIFEIFAKQKLKDIIHLLQSIFKEFNKIKVLKNRGDKISLKNISEQDVSFVNFHPLLNVLSGYTRWNFNSEYWKLEELEKRIFDKKIENVQGKRYKEIIEEKVPISWAITANKRIEYTVDTNSHLFF